MNLTGWSLRLGPPHNGLVPVLEGEGGMLYASVPGGQTVMVWREDKPAATLDAIEYMAIVTREKAACEVTVVRPGTRDDEFIARLATIEQTLARIEAKLAAPVVTRPPDDCGGGTTTKITRDESVCGVSFIPEGYTRPYVCDGPKGHSDCHATGHPGWSERQISGKRESTGDQDR